MAQGSIFRQKSLERAASPEQLDQYIRVSSPGAWTLLALIVALIAIALVAVLGAMSGQIGEKFNMASKTLNETNTNTVPPFSASGN